MSAFEVRRDVPLAPRTTFELGGAARAFVEARDEASVLDAFAWARAHAMPALVLGGGSNLIVADAGVDALVVAMATRGVTSTRRGDVVEVEAQAGEPWDAFVARTVEDGLAGLECLAGIPGTVGATPVQNVGAYGQEVSDTIVSVRALDTRTGEIALVPAAACGFSYRDSAFKRAAHLCVLSVTFALREGAAPSIRYAELARALDAAGRGRAATLAEVRETILALRRGKGMVLDPEDPERRTAGSFFTNPIVSADVAAHVREVALAAGLGEPPSWPQPEGRVKLAAGWLIERAGVARGTARGPVGVSRRHALALVHHGGGTTRALLGLAAEIVATVEARFGVTLAREPVLWGA